MKDIDEGGDDEGQEDEDEDEGEEEWLAQDTDRFQPSFIIFSTPQFLTHLREIPWAKYNRENFQCVNCKGKINVWQDRHA